MSKPKTAQENSTRVLIDLTDIEQWQGNHGGTQRVVYGIAKNFFLRQNTAGINVEFVSFSPEEKSFFFSDFSNIYERVENRNTGTTKKARTSIVEKLKLNYVGRRIRKSPNNDVSSRRWVDFRKDDYVLILGKPWDNLDIQKTLSQKKTECDFKIAQVVYDLIICQRPHLQNPVLVEPYTENMIGAIANSDLMLAISESSASDLKEFCKTHKLKEPNTQVIRLGDDIIDLPPQELRKPDQRIESKFIVCVGTIEIRKNHLLLYYTYKLAAQRGIDMPQLVIIGSQGWLTSEVQYLISTDESVKEKIIMLHDIDDRGLAWAYNNCMFSVYPSMYEGWGLPVAESLAYGKFCISSNVSSMPEIAGDLIDYFSPYSPDECLQKIMEYVDDEKLLAKEKSIKTIYRTTSWEQTFDQILDYVEKQR